MPQVDPRLDYGLSALPLVESPAVLQVTTVLFLSLIFSLNSNNSVGYYNINNRIASLWRQKHTKVHCVLPIIDFSYFCYGLKDVCYSAECDSSRG